MSRTHPNRVNEIHSLLAQADDELSRGDRTRGFAHLHACIELLRIADVDTYFGTPALLDRAAALIRETDSGLAIELLERALELAARNKQSDTSSLHYSLGCCLAEANRFNEAAGHLLECREHVHQCGDAEIIINCEACLGHCLLLMGRPEANQIVRDAYEAACRILPEDHVLRAKSALSLLDNAVAASDLAEADRLLDELAALPAMQQPRLFCQALNARARRYQQSGDYDEAEKSFRQAADLMERTFGAANTGTIMATHNLGQFLYNQGRYREAEELVERIQQSVCALQNPDPLTLALIHHLASGIAERCGDRRWFLEQAAETVETIERCLGPDDLFSIMARVNLAKALRYNGRFEEAWKVLNWLRPKLLGGPDDYNFWNECGLVLARLGRHRDALRSFERALKLMSAAGRENHPETIAIRCNVAQVASRLNEGEMVRKICRTTRQLIECAPVSPREKAIDLGTLALPSALCGDLELACEDLRRALAFHRQMLPVFMSRTSLHRQWAYLQDASGFLTNVLAFCSRFPDHNADLGFDAVLLLKGRLVDVTRDQWESIQAVANPKISALLQSLREINQQLVSGYMSSDVGSVTIERLIGRREAIQQLLSQQVKLPEGGRSEATVKSINDALNQNGAALVEYVRCAATTGEDEAQYVAFVMFAGRKPRLIVLDLPADVIDRLARQLRESCERGEDTQWRGFAGRTDDARRCAERGDLAGKLYRALVAPLGLPSTGSILIAPDGELNQIPFAVLRNEADQQLIDVYTISYLACARDLVTFWNRASFGPAVFFGSPHYHVNPDPARSASSRAVFRDLPLTGREVEEAAATFPASRTLVGAAATKEALQAVTRPAVLHVATHGWFSNENAPPTANVFPAEAPFLQCGLALAGANWEVDGVSPGMISALEIANLDLRGCRLATISACESARGTVRAGDGVYSMRRALALAGAQAQLVSLWQVNDESTTELMKYFYELLRHRSAAEALREAQRCVREDIRYRSPYYWAAFVLSGDPAPVTELFATRG